MGCRKHSPGDPCCVDCCGELTAPSGWVGSHNCCYECLKTITEEWTVECSAAIREDTRSASVDIQVYRRLTDTVQGVVTCVEDPPSSGLYTCTVGGIAFPACRTPYLCGTISISKDEHKVLKLVARWKAISQGTTLSRVMIQCGDDLEPTCKWLLISRRCLQIEWGTYWFTDGHHVRSDDSVCCVVTPINSTTTVDSCATAAATVYSQNTATVCIVRYKFYDTLPTGVITFSPGDSLSTCDLTGVTLCDANVDGTYDTDDVVAIVGPTSSTAIPWTAPTCTQDEVERGCAYGYLNDFDVCEDFQVFDLGQLITIKTAILAGSLLGGEHNNIYFDATCDGADYCTDWSEFDESRCVGLTSSRTDSGHTNRTITINYPAWTVDLGGGCA